MKICEHCNSEYDEENLSIPEVLPDMMCAFCGTILDMEYIQSLPIPPSQK